ncbi:unnamed protein product [Bursaphelenchus okinawaensis]|uniref:Ig-like domain-containing protein n=1 Tax=Bursaphelenchus okinawaensis TaxID=465554 RepID=A0A811KDR3_9BILA|nr:unnamed protein product [Bursaphelenchus okinawaensis]CAG9101718.1 unnamed protein product [Bursaphelenchus okinawaensis]
MADGDVSDAKFPAGRRKAVNKKEEYKRIFDDVKLEVLDNLEELTWNRTFPNEVKDEPMEESRVLTPDLPSTSQEFDEEEEKPELSTFSVTDEAASEADVKVETRLLKSNVAQDGGNLSIDALIAGNLKESDVTWIVNDEPLISSETISILTQVLEKAAGRNIILTTLTIPSKDITDVILKANDLEKQFLCKLEEPTKDKLRWIEKPCIDISDNNEIILKGLFYTPKPPKITWTKDWKPIKPGRILESNRKLKDGQYKCELKMVKFKRDRDEGDYMVEVKANGHTLTGKILLSFHKDDKPRIVRKPKIDEATNKAGEEFTVFTVVFGATVEYTVKWFREYKNKEPKLLSNKGRKRYNVKPTDRPNVYEARLRIRQHRPADSGIYRCQVETAAGQCQAKLCVKLVEKKAKMKRIDQLKKSESKEKKDKKKKEGEVKNGTLKNGKQAFEKALKKRKLSETPPKDTKKKKKV